LPTSTIIRRSQSLDDVRTQLLGETVGAAHVAEVDLVLLQSRLSREKNKIARLEVRAERKTNKAERLKAKRDAALAEYNRLKKDHAKASVAAQSALNGAQAAKDAVTELKKEINTHKKVVKKAKRTLGKSTEILETRAASIVSVLGLIDQEDPIIIQPNRIRWTSKPIFIHHNGEPIEHIPLGRWKVDIKMTKRGAGAAVLGATFRCLDPYPGGRPGMHHPHINERGGPCLGNASQMLTGAMSSGDPGQVIRVATDYLQSYYVDHGGARLMEWAPNIIDNYLCGCCGRYNPVWKSRTCNTCKTCTKCKEKYVSHAMANQKTCIPCADGPIAEVEATATLPRSEEEQLIGAAVTLPATEFTRCTQDPRLSDYYCRRDHGDACSPDEEATTP
jgi:hypothetical protein